MKNRIGPDVRKTLYSLTFAFLAAFGFAAPLAVSAQVELSFMLGSQSSPHSRVTGTDPDNPVSTDLDFLAGWEGRSFTAPIYYGVRATWWRDSSFGFGVEMSHGKVYADAETLAANGFDILEFTDGINIFTLNGLYRWPDRWGSFTPYVGGGLGVSVPYVEVQSGGGDPTFEYQLTGPAVRWLAGASYQISESWSVFGEYQGTYSVNTATLDNGGSLSTNIVTNALNVGVSFAF